MLKIKDNISLKDLEEFGFKKPSNTRGLWKYVLWDDVVRIWIDKYGYLHYNMPKQSMFDLIYVIHDLLELDTNPDYLRVLSKSTLLEENKKLKQKIKRLEKIIDKK